MIRANDSLTLLQVGLSIPHAELQKILRNYRDKELFTEAFVGWGNLFDANSTSHCAIGLLNDQIGSESVVFDLASLTKLLVTAPLVQRFKTTVQEWMQNHLVDILRPDSMDVDLLLSHRSGLRAWASFYTDCSDNDSGVLTTQFENAEFSFERRKERIFEVLKRPTHSNALYRSEEDLRRNREVYSDIGFIILGLALENSLQMPLNQAFATFLLGNPASSLSDQCLTGFVSRDSRSLKIKEISPYAPNGFSRWTGNRVEGFVQDENSRSLGGVCGHAGLFSTGPSLLNFLHLLALKNEWKQLIDLSLPDFKQRVIGPSYGFRRADDKVSSLLFGLNEGLPVGLGHYGYSGTSFWFNPLSGHFHLLLCNRLHKGIRDHSMIREFRSKVLSVDYGFLPSD